MTEEKFNIVFRGDIVAGHKLPEVKQRLAQLFKIDTAKVEPLFSGRAVVLKRNLDSATANKYQQVLTKAGAQVSISAADGVAKPAAQSPKPKPQSTLKERLAQAEAQTGAPPSTPSTSPSTPPPQAAPAKPVDAGGISIRPMEGELLDASEKKPPEAREVDTSSLSMADVGADMLTDSERPSPPAPVASPDFDIAEVGADLADAKPALPELDIDFSRFDLAPAGSDMNQAKKPAPPPPPDTSGLSVSD